MSRHRSLHGERRVDTFIGAPPLLGGDGEAGPSGRARLHAPEARDAGREGGRAGGRGRGGGGPAGGGGGRSSGGGGGPAPAPGGGVGGAPRRYGAKVMVDLMR